MMPVWPVRCQRVSQRRLCRYEGETGSDMVDSVCTARLLLWLAAIIIIHGGPGIRSRSRSDSFEVRTQSFATIIMFYMRGLVHPVVYCVTPIFIDARDALEATDLSELGDKL